MTTTISPNLCTRRTRRNSEPERFYIIMSNKRWEFRDVSVLLQSLRAMLLGRKHNLHLRFPPNVAPRSIPPPDIPRGPEYKYSKQYYYQRSAFDSVQPPVIAPVGEGPPAGRDLTQKAQPSGFRPDSVCFPGLPTPGTPWGWDGHSYFECTPEPELPPPCPPPPCPPPPRARSCEPSPCPPPSSNPCLPSNPPRGATSPCEPPPCPKPVASPCSPCDDKKPGQ